MFKKINGSAAMMRSMLMASVAMGAWHGAAFAATASQAPLKLTLTSDQSASVPKAAPAAPPVDALSPTMFGWRPWLNAHGIDMMLDETDEFATTISSYRNPTTNTGQYSWWTNIDWDKLAGIPGFSTHTIIVGRYGNDSSHKIGDAVSSSQEIYGSGGNVFAHLVEAYGEESLFDNRVDVVLGIEPMLWDFAGAYLQCSNFMNDALCGNPTIGYENGPYSVFPDWSYAARIQISPTPTTYIKTGLFYTQQNIYQINHGFRSGFMFDAAQVKRPTIPVELGWTPAFGAEALPGHYKAGVIFDENVHPDDYYDINGNAWAQTGLPPREVKSAPSEYIMVDQMFVRNGPGPFSGLIGFASYWHDAANWFTVGLVDHGFWSARPDDGAAIGFVYAIMPPGVRKTEQLQQKLGLPITGDAYGLPFNGNAVTGVQSTWPMLELQYQIHVTRGVTVSPDFQYYFRPNAQSNLPPAAFVGFRTHITLF